MKEDLKLLTDVISEYRNARNRYNNHPGGGASQVVKNRLFKECMTKQRELDDVTLKIKHKHSI